MLSPSDITLSFEIKIGFQFCRIVDTSMKDSLGLLVLLPSTESIRVLRVFYHPYPLTH